MIWQLADSADLLMGRRLTVDARVTEKALIADFVRIHGKRIFANRTA